jgi:hypothetical protein
MLERSHRAAFHPIVTYRANAAHRFFAVGAPPAREERPAGAPARARAPRRCRRRGRAPPAARAPPAPRAATFGDPRLAAHLATASA